MGSSQVVLALAALGPVVLSAAVVAATARLPAGERSISEPLLEGADPSVVFHDGFYYLVQSENVRGIAAVYLYKSATLADIGRGEKVRIHLAPATGPRSRNLWAPELHLLGGRWYVYFAADDGRNENHRMYVMASEGGNPAGPYGPPKKIGDATDRWAIDGTVMERGGKQYFLWSGWEGVRNGQQNLYIAAMKDPETIVGPRVRISSPDQPWERVSGAYPCYVNEGPAVLKRGGRLFVTYSANGFWSEDYCLGLLTLAGENPLEPGAWKKSGGPVFSKTDFAFNVGHNCFVASPDGSEDWLVYHAVDRPHSGGKGRTIRTQPISWRADGTPQFGRPVASGTALAAPSGEMGVRMVER